MGYALVGLSAFWSSLPDISTRLFGVEADFAQSAWFLGWVPHAIAHGVNPLLSNAVLAPQGIDLAQNTSSPLLGLAAAPLVLVFSPVVIINLLMVAAMPVSATAAYVVLRTWEVRTPAAALAGLMYGFSPYMIGQGLGHLELMFLPLPPFIALVTASILRGGGTRKSGIQLGLLLAGQYLISPEIFAAVGLLILLAAACVARRVRWGDVLEPVITAALVAGVILAYPVILLFSGTRHITSTWPSVNPFHNDLLSFLVPGPLQRVSLGLRGIGTRLSAQAGATEAGGYIGIPVLAVAAYFAWRCRSSPRMRLAVALLLGTVLFSLGPRLAVDGHLSIPLPFAALDRLPLLNNILPSRLNFEVSACLAAVIAFGLDERRRHAHPRVWGVVVVSVIVVFTQLPWWPAPEPYVPQAVPVLPSSVLRALPPDDPLAITFPYASPYAVAPMLWQLDSGFKFRLLGGYGYHPNEKGILSLWPLAMRPKQLQQFLATESGLTIYGSLTRVTAPLFASTRLTMAKYGISVVIVDRSVAHSGTVTRFFRQVLGPPDVASGRYLLWNRRPSSP